MVQWLRLGSWCRGHGFVPGWETRSYMPQLQDPHAPAKYPARGNRGPAQPNKYISKYFFICCCPRFPVILPRESVPCYTCVQWCWTATVAGVDMLVNENPRESGRPLFKGLQFEVARSHYWRPRISSVDWGWIKKPWSWLTFLGRSECRSTLRGPVRPSGPLSCICFLLPCAQRSEVLHWSAAGLLLPLCLLSPSNF